MRPRCGNFLILQDGGRRHLGFSKFETFNGGTAREGRTASPCQILSKSVKLRPRYGDFSFYQDGGRSHFGFLKFGTFNGPTAQERRTASPCKISLKLHKTRPRYGDFSIFPIWRLIEIDAVVLIICMFFDFSSLAGKRLFTPPKLGFLGDLTP